MTADEVLAVLEMLARAGVNAWVDGGWGVDALLGRQTRAHSDLDLVVPHDSVVTVRSLLEAHGFEMARDWLPTAIAFRHPDGREVDLHPIEPTPDGGGNQIQLNGLKRWHYEAPVTGRIGGVDVWCCPVTTQLRAHLGYEPGDTDFTDMHHLRDELGVELPPPYNAT